MMIDALFVNQKVILANTPLIHSVTAAMNSATLHKTAQTRFLPWEHHTTNRGLIQGNDTPPPKGTDHTPATMDTDMGDISTNHNHTTISTMTGAVAVPEGTYHAFHPATTAAHATLWSMEGPITTFSMTHTTGIVTPHSTLTTSSTDITHVTIPNTRAGLTPSTLTAWHW